MNPHRDGADVVDWPPRRPPPRRGRLFLFAVLVVLRLIALGLAVVIALITGAGMMAEWPALATYWYAPPGLTTATDPIFGRPIAFYLFTLPAWQLFTGWLLTLAVFWCGVALFFIV